METDLSERWATMNKHAIKIHNNKKQTSPQTAASVA